jgi:hypothetical protein
MKTLIATLLISFSTIACSKEQPAKPAEPAKVEAKKEEVKKEETKKPETKRVCIMVWDAKQNKEVEKCRTMKIHEKHEGNKVPTK